MADDKKKDIKEVIPVHENVIKNHVNILIFHKEDSDKSDPLGWITIMENCDKCLRVELKKETLNLTERKKIALGVLSGFEYLRKIGIKHYDLKPENILLKDGKPRIIDYGLIDESTGRISYRQMGYCRVGTKYRNYNYLRKFNLLIKLRFIY